MDGEAATPAATHLFKVNTEDPKVLDQERKNLFVHLVMQGLYLSQQGRPDIRMAISFLRGRLTCPDEDDFKKLTRMIRYLRHTLHMCLVLSKDDTDNIRWWIDASYAVHPDMRGHTGATMSMGSGSVFSGSWKQKLVMRSSTESEVVGVYDVLPQILWTKKFLEDQGVSIKDTVLYQDNMSSILLERNGRQSSTKRMKHMTFDISTLGSIFRTRPCLYNTVRPTRCWPITLQSHCKGHFSSGSGTTSWVLSLRMEIHKLKGVCWEGATFTTPRRCLSRTRQYLTYPQRHPNGRGMDPSKTRMGVTRIILVPWTATTITCVCVW